MFRVLLFADASGFCHDMPWFLKLKSHSVMFNGTSVQRGYFVLGLQGWKLAEGAMDCTTPETKHKLVKKKRFVSGSRQSEWS